MDLQTRPSTPNLPRTAANRLVDGRPSGIDLDPLAFADNGAEWRIMQAFIMLTMFDAGGCLKHLWPDLDQQLKQQAVRPCCCCCSLCLGSWQMWACAADATLRVNADLCLL